MLLFGFNYVHTADEYFNVFLILDSRKNIFFMHNLMSVTPICTLPVAYLLAT